jgi:hypothetical protein
MVCSNRSHPHTLWYSIAKEDPIMFYALSWFAVVALLALWSLAAWALNAVAVWTVSNAGALSGAASGAGTIRLPDWLAPWVPPEFAQSVSQMLAGLGPVVDSLLQAAPALAGGLTAATWVVWGIGSALLLMLGAGMHLLIALWRRRGSGGSGPNAGPSLAAG